jgi:(2Fe-2S) ferredoxin
MNCHVNIICTLEKCKVTSSIIVYVSGKHLREITVNDISMYVKMHASWGRMILSVLCYAAHISLELKTLLC